MRAAVLTQPGEIQVRDRDRPDPADGDVLVRVEACGVCATDFHMYEGGLSVPLPMVPGHESAGEVVSTGADVTRVSTGDRVAVNPSVPCGACRYCTSGREHLCPDLTSIGGAAHTVVDGSFAEYVAVPAGNVVSIGDLDATTAAFAEPLGCVVHGVDRVGAREGDTVAVIGAGSIGLEIVKVLWQRGARPVVVEPVDERRERARDAGAVLTVDPTDADPVAAVREAVGPVDAAIEAVGFPETIAQARDLCGDGAPTLVFGVPPEDATIEVSPFDVFYGERDLLGTYSLTPDDFERAVGLLRGGQIEVDSLITHEVGLADLPAAFDRMDRTVGLKQVVRPGQ
ncbi:MAG: alcohol dehydrogenase catalytic domain-containing protein [Haloarculaceae archaeon]